MDLNAEECYDILRLESLDDTLIKQSVGVHYCDEIDSGICGLDCKVINENVGETSANGRQLKTPIIMLNEDKIVDNIEMAQIESYFERISTPEGNVKYKNYKIVAPAPSQLRMYSPSGDIHTTPKKGKIVPKFDIFHNYLCPRDKLLTLIDKNHLASTELETIIKPSGISRRITELIRKTNKSSMEDRIEFLSGVLSPSPSSLSVLSDDSVFEIRHTPSPDQKECALTKPVHFLKSYSVEVDDTVTKIPKTRIARRQESFHAHDGNAYQMNLSDELKHADERTHPRSYTPRAMTEFEYHFFHRPNSSFSHKCISFCDKDKPRESKKSIIRNFIQRNMIDRSSNRDKLAKLALAIEEDTEPESIAFISSARTLEDKLTAMLDEVKGWKSELVEIQEDIQDDERRVTMLIEDAKLLLTELRSTNYLDDIIHLLHGNLEAVASHKTWPFTGYVNGKRKNSNTNLII